MDTPPPSTLGAMVATAETVFEAATSEDVDGRPAAVAANELTAPDTATTNTAANETGATDTAATDLPATEMLPEQTEARPVGQLDQGALTGVGTAQQPRGLDGNEKRSAQ